MRLCYWLLSVACFTRVLAAQPLPVFEDRREAAGIDFVHQSGRTSEKFLIETMGGGVGLLDYDRDGLLDICFEPQ